MYFSPHRLCLLSALLLVVPWISEAVPACDVTLCSPPFDQGEAVTCDLGRCYSCLPQLSGDDLYYRVAFNTTHCAAACSRAGTREGVSECAQIYDDGPRYCANITTIGFQNSTGTLMNGDGDLYDYVGVCLSCGEGKSPNPSGNGCETAAPSNTSAPASALLAPPRAPSPPSRPNTTCADVADCNLPRRLGSAGFCFEGGCGACSGRPNGNSFSYQVPSNSTHCKPACIRPNTSSGILECESIYSNANALSKGRYYCKSLVDVPGYESRNSTFVDRFGNIYDFTGICQDCGVGMEPNAAGTGCQMIMASPAPPPVSSNPNGTCKTVQECAPPEKDGESATCFLGECGYCPSRENGPNQFFAVASDYTYCKPACTSPGTGIGMLECNTIYSNAIKYRGSFYCEHLLNITGYSTNSSMYLDSTGKAYSFAGICLLCDPDKNLIPDHTGSRCVDRALSPSSASLAEAPDHMSPPGSTPLRLPPLELPRSVPRPPSPPSLLSNNQTLDRQTPPFGNAPAPGPSASSSMTLQDFTLWRMALLAATATIVRARW